ncbi:GNAT family N-acetyltransferase [Saccharicrinis sp. 156]|uniref:GNAT family N-acetyltransferase n=1 Tax=Saccharicrinis sp. 156 TaxID=3417574 RepID=UPI003D32BD55
MDISEYANSVFEQPWWLNTVAPNQWREVVIKEEGKIVARWAFVEKGKSIIMPMLTQTLGIWISEDILEYDKYDRQQKKILNKLIDEIISKKGISLCLNSNNTFFMPFYWRGFKVTPFVSYRLNDLTNLDAIYTGFSSNVKNSIERASKKLKIVESDNIDKLISLVDNTFRRKKMQRPWSVDLIKDIYYSAKQNNGGKLLFAIDKEKNVHSGTLFIYDQKVFYNLISGSDYKYKNSGAATLLLWEGIKHAATTSMIFDFEGSMKEGINRFYAQFGGKQVIYYGIYKPTEKLFRQKSQKLIRFLKNRVKKRFVYR